MRTVMSALSLAAIFACGGSEPYDPGVRAAEFGATVSHAFFPHPAGARWIYSGTTSGGTERIEVEVLPEKKTVAWGVESTVVRDTAYLNGEKIEETRDWLAQHSDGSVWYMGEDTAEYEKGMIINHNGAWEAGVDGALPGILMPANPVIGQKYRQEYYQDEAEDYGEIVALDASVTVPAGNWSNCLKTHDTSAIDDTLSEYKYYCSGVGLALVEDGSARVELIEYSLPQN